jgi:ketosteroid isomerase-like protein
MKKLFSVLVIALGAYCISCKNMNATGLSATAQKNLDAMHAIAQCFDSKDFSKLGDYIAVDAVDHAGEKGDVKGLANMKTQFESWAASIESQKSETIKELADDDYAMSWYHYTGAYKTAGMGHKAGDRFDMKVLEVAKFKDGKATEHWSLMEPGEVAKMMSSMQPTQMMQPADTAK